MSTTDLELLHRARAIAEDVLAPNANTLDQGEQPPLAAVRLLAEAGLLGISTPAEFGGAGATRNIIRKYTETLSGACGTTCFLQGQHISACTLIAASSNTELKATALPDLAKGRRLSGVAFAHVRRPGPPTLRVEETSGGFLFNGTAAWFTGWGVMTDVVIAGTLPDGRYVYVLVPLDQGPHLTASAPMRLCAMNASITVSLTCEDLFVPRGQEVKCLTPHDMSVTDAAAILSITPQVFGVTRASISLVRTLGEGRGQTILHRSADTLEMELAYNRERSDIWRDRRDDQEYGDQALDIRARCVEMGVRAAHMSVTASAGAANSRNHTAQRLFREAMFYTIISQTRDIQTSMLSRLIASSEAVVASASLGG